MELSDKIRSLFKRTTYENQPFYKVIVENDRASNTKHKETEEVLSKLQELTALKVTPETYLPKAILDDVFPHIVKKIEDIEDKIVAKFSEKMDRKISYLTDTFVTNKIFHHKLDKMDQRSDEMKEYFQNCNSAVEQRLDTVNQQFDQIPKEYLTQDDYHRYIKSYVRNMDFY